MNLIDSLKFVQGAVSKTGFDPEMTHYSIKDGYVASYNGMTGLKCPIDIDIEVVPKASEFFKAIAACHEVTTLTVTPKGKLSVKSGNFKALVNCIEKENFSSLITDAGESAQTVMVNADSFLEGLKILKPFIGDDASRPWANAVLFDNGFLFATNNVICTQYYVKPLQAHPYTPLRFAIPAPVVNELLRIKHRLTRVQVDKQTAWFVYDNGAMLRVNLYNANEWPDVNELVKKAEADGNKSGDPRYFSAKLIEEALTSLGPFADDMGRLYFNPQGEVSTFYDNDEAATVKTEVNSFKLACFNVEMLKKLPVDSFLSFINYPRPCFFFNEKIKGVIMGMTL